MLYTVEADHIIYPDDDTYGCKVYRHVASRDETVWCMKDERVSRFRNGRYYPMTGTKFIQTLQKALEQYDESGLKSGLNGDVIDGDGNLFACRAGFFELVDSGFVDQKTLKYTGKRVTMDDIDLAFRRWSWVDYLYYVGRLKK